METYNDNSEKNAETEKVSDAPGIDVSTITKGFFLIFLAICGNFIAELLGCKTQQFLSNNMWGKHLILIFSLYFAIGFASDGPRNPISVLGETVSVWTLFLLFTKCSPSFTVMIFIAVAIYYILNNFLDYYNDSVKLSEKKINLLQKIKKIWLYLIIVLIVLGFSLYSIKQYNDHSDTFSVTKLLFGVLECDYTKE